MNVKILFNYLFTSQLRVILKNFILSQRGFISFLLTSYTQDLLINVKFLKKLFFSFDWNLILSTSLGAHISNKILTG